MSTMPRGGATRRDLLFGSAATILLAAGCDPAAGATPIRPDINSPAGARMTSLYATAVRQMQNAAINMPPQPQSWTFQSYMHGVPANPFDPANSPGLTRQNGLVDRINQIYGNPAAGTPQASWKQAALACWATCEHNSAYFTIWHRWYIYFFERICRRMCNDASFMLPYWNYASDRGPSLQLPVQFRNPQPDQSGNRPVPSALVFDDRGLGIAPSGTSLLAMNDGGYMDPQSIIFDTTFETNLMFPADVPAMASASNAANVALAAKPVLGFCGRLENLPHDAVHGAVGGWMGSVPSAAGDPIFYVHHCQIDRLLASWEALHGTAYNWGNSDAAPSQATWTKRQANFVDEKDAGGSVQLARAVTVQNFGYGYDALYSRPVVASRAAPILPGAHPLQLAAMRTGRFQVEAGGTSVTLTAQDGAATAALTHSKPAILILENIKLVRRPPAPLRVYINLPKDSAPNPTGPYYVGTLNLFKFDIATGNLMMHGEHQGMTPPRADAQFDVTDILLTQHASGLWAGGPVTVTVTTGGPAQGGGVVYLTVAGAQLAR